MTIINKLFFKKIDTIFIKNKKKLSKKLIFFPSL